MTESITLTNYDFNLESKINDDDFNETYQKYCIHIIDNDNKTAKQIKYQILKNQEKVEKLGKLLNSKTIENKNNFNLITLREIITALSDYHNRCTICYRYSKGNNCEKCNEYYLDCTCTPLTPSQITQGVGM